MMTVVLLEQSTASASIGCLSASVGCGGFGTEVPTGDRIRHYTGRMHAFPVDFASNCGSLGLSTLPRPATFARAAVNLARLDRAANPP